MKFNHSCVARSSKYIQMKNKALLTNNSPLIILTVDQVAAYSVNVFTLQIISKAF